MNGNAPSEEIEYLRGRVAALEDALAHKHALVMCLLARIGRRELLTARRFMQGEDDAWLEALLSRASADPSFTGSDVRSALESAWRSSSRAEGSAGDE